MALRKIRKISQNELKEILCLHHRFLMKDPSGSRADLQRADLRGANLRGANLQGADFQEADLIGANLQGADLRNAYLLETYLLDADLRGANLRGAKFDQMIPRSCWISSSRWLRSDIPWWIGHPQQNDIVLCDE